MKIKVIHRFFWSAVFLGFYKVFIRFLDTPESLVGQGFARVNYDKFTSSYDKFTSKYDDFTSKYDKNTRNYDIFFIIIINVKYDKFTSKYDKNTRKWGIFLIVIMTIIYKS